MRQNDFDINSYLDGEVSLPATFTTGFRRDLELARAIIRRRQGKEHAPRSQVVTDTAGGHYAPGPEPVPQDA